MSYNDSLPKIINNLRQQASQEKRAIVVLDTGIATENNLTLLQAKDYDYVYVSSSKIKDYNIDKQGCVRHILTKDNQIITLQKIKTVLTTNYVSKVKSTAKAAKERAMKNKFEERYLEEINKIKTSLTKKHGVKKADKVNQRIGRAVEKYPSAARFYSIEVLSENELATQIICQKKTSSELNDKEFGSYFIKTNLNTENEMSLWTVYNATREIESTFRYLKTDLALRPIYHKNDDATMADLHLGILGYWLANTIWHQLKQQKTKHNRQEKIKTTTGQNKEDQIIYVRRCSEPNQKIKKFYTALNYKNYPFVKRKSEVHKSELKKYKSQCLWETDDG